MELEKCNKWEPIDGITTPASHALIEEVREGLFVTLVFSQIQEGRDADLKINFGRVPAYSVHEEFVHPWNSYKADAPPELAENWSGWSFPLVIVKNSVWLQSFSEIQMLNYKNSIHYRLITLDQTVDVICNTVPEVIWI
jgi:hypothetical protein